MIVGGQRVVKTKDLSRPWRVWLLGDVHLGAIGCAEPLFDETVARIRKDPRGLWLGMGDYIDLISCRDKRFDAEAIAVEHRAAYFKRDYGRHMKAIFQKKIAPIASKCLGLMEGNHEWSYGARYEQQIVRDICAPEKEGGLGTKLLGYCCFRDLVFTDGKRREVFRICAHHGTGNARTKGGKFLHLNRFMSYFAGDIYALGHSHVRMDDDVIVIQADKRCQHLTQTTKVGVVSGTFLRTYTEEPDGASGYGERALYEPTPLGSPCVVINPSTRRMSIEKPWVRNGIDHA